MAPFGPEANFLDLALIPKNQQHQTEVKIQALELFQKSCPTVVTGVVPTGDAVGSFLAGDFFGTGNSSFFSPTSCIKGSVWPPAGSCAPGVEAALPDIFVREDAGPLLPISAAVTPVPQDFP